MKILAIRGENLASLEGAFEIDFTQEPLRSAGIFAITGHTGAGKSTLLDALCLALFEKIPRNRNVSKGIKIEDVKGNEIAQQDSRTILRRGSSSGYAEVDFVSQGGDSFRARWSVRRSYNKVDGSLQDAVYQVTNLTTNIPLGGTKTELLAQVVELVGLSFDQFTRSVLLAQGDFSTFLKAGPNEKAELLEKLTGTEIYSRISRSIFQKEKEAHGALDLIRERIKGLDLLSEEELQGFQQEQDTLTKQLSKLEQTKKVLEVKTEWLEEMKTRKRDVLDAETAFRTAKQRVDEAKPRTAYLDRIDKVQEIREPYRTWVSASTELTNNLQNQVIQKQEMDRVTRSLAEVSQQVTAVEEEQTAWRKEMALAAPLLKEARMLDVRISEKQKSFDEAKKALAEGTKGMQDTDDVIAHTSKAIQVATKRIAAIESWYKEHQQYEQAVLNANLVSNQLSGATELLNNGKAYSKALASEEEALKADNKRLEEQQKEGERLNQLLPEEVIILRKELVEGKPCPVCGSTHHLLREVNEADGLKEASLNQAKKRVADEVTKLTKDVEERKGRINSARSLLQNCREQYKDMMAYLKKWLGAIPDWQHLFQQGTLQGVLTTVTAQWMDYDKELTKIKEGLTKDQTTLQLKQDARKGMKTDLTAKKAAYDAMNEAYAEMLEARKKLFQGKPADAVEADFDVQEKKLTMRLDKLTKNKEKIVSDKHQRKGVLAQMKDTIVQIKNRQQAALEQVNDWLTTKQEDFSMASLGDLLAKDNAWVTAEREALKQLDTHLATANATLAERRKQLAAHLKKEVRPSDDESEEVLHEAYKTCCNAMDTTRARQTEVLRVIKNQAENIKKVTQLRREETEKAATADNWAKLNQLFGSSTGTKFKVLAQGYTLDVLLAYANKHLEELTKRYTLQRIGSSLGLQVADLDMLGEVRSVHSLSGGESFLISLALALGLSSLSSNRMNVESLFIDEGFGSLDVDTLRVAVDALERLQTQGRKIGVISHVVEMTERITTQIRVLKSANGRSRIEVVG